MPLASSQQIGMSSSAEASYYSLLRNAAHREAGVMLLFKICCVFLPIPCIFSPSQCLSGQLTAIVSYTCVCIRSGPLFLGKNRPLEKKKNEK